MSPWRKWWADLASTRIQLTYLVVGLFSWTIIKGIRLAANVQDVAILLGTLTPVFAGVIAWHLTGKWMDIRANGHRPVEQKPPP